MLTRVARLPDLLFSRFSIARGTCRPEISRSQTIFQDAFLLCLFEGDGYALDLSREVFFLLMLAYQCITPTNKVLRFDDFSTGFFLPGKWIRIFFGNFKLGGLKKVSFALPTWISS
jgi:hypothetical protein